MIFQETRLPGVVEIRLEPHRDERGFFARSWCQTEFQQHGLSPATAQCNISFNEKKGTLRGMHYQTQPHAEAKLVRCTQGSIFDVAVDLRPDSITFKQWVGVTLTSSERNALYVPECFAHGFLTLEDQTEIFYQMSEFYHPELSRGVRWDDPAFGIAWPAEPQIISASDRSHPDFK